MPDIGGLSFVLGIVYGLLMLIFFIVFLVNLIVLRKAAFLYLRYGLVAGAVLVLSEILVIAAQPSILQKMPLYIIVPVDALTFIRFAAFTMLGIYFCRVLGVPSFPLLIRRLPEPPAPAVPNALVPPPPAGLTPAPPLAPLDAQAMPPAPSEVPPPIEPDRAYAQSLESAPLPSETLPPLSPDLLSSGPPASAPAPGPQVNRRSALLAGLLVAAGSVAFSTALFFLIPTQMSRLLKDLTETDLAQKGLGASFTLTALIVVVSAALGEEVIFRLGIQNYLARGFKMPRHGYTAAIVMTALIWTIGHAGVTNPEWVKLVQMLPIGLALGWLFKKFGTESCMIAHGTFNIIMLALSPYLIGR